MSSARFVVGDTRKLIAKLPDASVDLIVTSPPFLAMRSYLPDDHEDKGSEIGSEGSPGEFLATLLELAVEWRRVLTPYGSICVELGDGYSGSGGHGGDYAEGGLREGQPKFEGSSRALRSAEDKPLPKSLMGIPTLFAWSLAYGRNLLLPEQTLERWRVRNLLSWSRMNPPVGELGDKFRPAVSYVTVACPSDRRWFDLDAVRVANERGEEQHKVGKYSSKTRGSGGDIGAPNKRILQNPGGAPPRDWWTDEDGPTGDRLWWMNTTPYSGAHYATFPAELPAQLVKAMCPHRVCTTCGEPSRRIMEPTAEYAAALGKSIYPGNETQGDRRERGRSAARGPETADRVTVGWTDCGHGTWRPGLVLDPFAGSGTTGLAATGAGRDALLFDLDARNVDLARDRIGMFLEVGV